MCYQEGMPLSDTHVAPRKDRRLLLRSDVVESEGDEWDDGGIPRADRQYCGREGFQKSSS